MVDMNRKAFHATARWRQREVGRVFAFAPALAEHSRHDNPIEAVGRDPQAAWHGGGLVELMTGRDGPDEEARGYLAPAI